MTLYFHQSNVVKEHHFIKKLNKKTHFNEPNTVKKGISFRRLEGTRNGEKIMEMVFV